MSNNNLNIEKQIETILLNSRGDIDAYINAIYQLIENELGIKLDSTTKKIVTAQAIKEFRSKLNFTMQTLNKNLTEINIDFPQTNRENRLNAIRANLMLLNNNQNNAQVSQAIATATREEIKKDVYKKTGFKRQWLSMRDALVRDAHAEADGQLEDEAGLFDVGGERLEAPGQGTIASNNIGCRCTTFPIRSRN